MYTPLTGSADLNAAIQAVNQGNIYRFLTKPCSSDALLDALKTGMQEYRHSHKERKFNRRTRRLLAQAMDIQQGLMPDEVPGIEGLDIAGRSIYCDQTGGDYYDYFEKNSADGRRVVVVVGDVSDHGLPSALLMTSARAFLRESAKRRGSVSAVVGSVNRQLTRDVQTSGRFMTLFYAEIDRGAQVIRWVRAGHEPAFLYDPASGQVEELGGRGGLPLGVFEEAGYEECSRQIDAGQVIAIGTDGIWEARNADGRMFGKQALQAMLRAHLRPPGGGDPRRHPGRVASVRLPPRDPGRRHAGDRQDGGVMRARRDCRRCVHFFVTWDERFPNGCRCMGFKSRTAPAEEVRRATGGGDCRLFKEKPPRRAEAA